jgi:hypothetical protein
MTWTSPATPVSGTAITVAFYATNIKDNLNHLRTLTGGDPGAASLVLVSTSTVAAAWTASPSIANLTITTGLTMNANLTMGSSNRKVMFAAEVGDKIDLTSSGTVLIGVASSTMYFRADGNYSWRNESGTERMLLTTGATPVLSVGGNTVATLNSANFTALSVGGVAVPKSATSSFTGNGSSGGVQITTGFTCKQVTLWQETSGTTYMILSTSASTRLVSTGNPTRETAVHLHASDGFVVGDGSDRGNNNGESYRWTALG